MNNNFSNDLKALIETYNIENKNVITYIPLDFRQSEIQDSEIPEPLNQVYALFGNHESLLRSKSAYLCKPEQLKRVDMTWQCKEYHGFIIGKNEYGFNIAVYKDKSETEYSYMKYITNRDDFWSDKYDLYSEIIYLLHNIN